MVPAIPASITATSAVADTPEEYVIANAERPIANFDRGESGGIQPTRSPIVDSQASVLTWEVIDTDRKAALPTSLAASSNAELDSRSSLPRLTDLDGDAQPEIGLGRRRRPTLPPRLWDESVRADGVDWTLQRQPC